MILANVKLPRQLEADETDRDVRLALTARTAKLWPGGDLDIAVIPMSGPLEQALRTARLMGRMRYGYEAIYEKLESERRGIESVRQRGGALYGDRVSRLLLLSNDGAERFYRHIELLLLAHAPRLLGCRLDMDGAALGRLIAGREKIIKAVMAEHKEAVSTILRAIAADPAALEFCH